MTVLSRIICSAVLFTACVGVNAQDSSELLAEASLLAPKSLLLDICNTNQYAVAVGQRGHVVISEDRQSWRQSDSVPTRSTLTAVYAIGNKVWAVGHDAVVIHSQDGGLNWELQQADPGLEQPLLDVMFIDENTGFAIGAYGYFIKTINGGQSWEESLISEEYDYHLNAILSLGEGRLYIAAEAGSGYLSNDNGDTWELIELPYQGSMFGVLSTPDNTLLTFGLRGHVFESSDQGASWQEVETGTVNSLIGGTVTENGSIALVGSSGQILVRPVGSQQFNSSFLEDGSDLAGVLVAPDSDLLIVGENGVSNFSLSKEPTP